MPAFLANLFSVEELQIIAGKTNNVKNQQKLHWQYMVLGGKEKVTFSFVFRTREVDMRIKVLLSWKLWERRGETCFGVSNSPR